MGFRVFGGVEFGILQSYNVPRSAMVVIKAPM